MTTNVLVIFGASGDLTSRKIIPALFHLFVQKKLPEPFFLLGISRSPLSSPEWREKLQSMAKKLHDSPDFQENWDRFALLLNYLPGNSADPSLYDNIEKILNAEKIASNGKDLRVLFYLSVAARLYPEIILHIGSSGLAQENSERKVGIILEKPFGSDLESSKELNRLTHSVFEEHQVFRIDHYLGKETVNNIFALRFANTIFEPVWNRNYIEHIQITANESVTIGRRGAFYETTGVLRDMFQNHLLQLLTITTMEPPSTFDAKSVRDEKVKVLRAIRRESTAKSGENYVLGQYRGYRSEPGVDPESMTPTFAGVRFFIDNWRWKDVPIYLRSGKGMSCQTTQILIQYRKPPHSIFGREESFFSSQEANQLLIQLQPSEGIRIRFLSKVPGTEMKLKNSELTFSFENRGKEKLPEAYERLLLDAFCGDSSLFTRNDEVEAAWEIIDPIQREVEEGWRRKKTIPLYEPGGWGPAESNDWLEKQGARWFDLCPIIRTE